MYLAFYYPGLYLYVQEFLIQSLLMKTLLLILSVCIFNSAIAKKYYFPSKPKNVKVNGKNFSAVASLEKTTGLKLTGARKNIPVGGDGGIYFFNNGFLQPGDTGCINAGVYPYVSLSGIVGTATNPITIINVGGQVVCGSQGSYCFRIVNSKYFKFTGAGAPGVFYGFKAYWSGGTTGVGMSAKDSTTDYEIDHLETQNVQNGFLCKIDPANCAPGTWSTGWTIKNISFHDCYVHNTVGEGMYIINTASTVDVLDCSGKTITIEPVKANGVKIYNTIVDSTGWDGIQLAASENAEIYNNKVTNYGMINMGSQQAGIILGGKSTGSVHDNFIYNGTGEGLQVFGYGKPISIYNNVIVHAGWDGTSNKQNAMNIDDRPDAITRSYTGLKVYVMNNTVVDAGRNAITINNSYGTMGTGNKVYNNLLVKPNNTSAYDNPYTSIGGALNVDTLNNIKISAIANASFVNSSLNNYHLLSNSPAVNAGLNATSYGVTKDLDGIARPTTAFDAGAYEYNGGAQPNKSPLANAGNDTAFNLPTNSTTLKATGTDSDGTISSYSWVKVSGPSSGTITSPTSASTSVTGLAQGVYKFSVTVTDNSGATGKDTVQVTVNAAATNKAPTANAGNNLAITLPVSLATLSGSGTDSDGTIKSYSWAKISGPSSGTIATPTLASTTVTGLAQGVYSYVLTVTDNNGATGKDTMQVSVNAAGNKVPTAVAGADLTIILPVNSTTLLGSGTDSDGTISSYSWAKISGPLSGTMASSTSASTLVSDLTQGTYVYTLTVTDNNGAVGKDTVVISVNTASASGTKYYFSASSGDDSRTTDQAKNSSTPWKTLAKLNSIFTSLKPGDSVLFKRGETFNGSITIGISGSSTQPIVLGAYGTGDRPVISGFTTLTGWVSVGNNIYESYNSALGPTINIVTINGAQQPPGRYPNYNTANRGYLTFESHGTNYLVDKELTSAINWTGAELVVRPKRWILDRTTVTAHSGTKITFSPALTYDPYDNYGYFFQNHIKTLDLPGEWCYNPSTKKVSVYSMPGVFKASTVNTLVSINNKSNIVFDNLVFTGSNQRTFDLYYANNVRISNCDISFSGIDGIYGSSTTKFVLENSTLTNTNNNGINLSYNAVTCAIRNNVIRNNSIYPGLGTSGNGNYQAVIVNGKSNLIEYNEIDSAGFTGIRFSSGDSNVVKNNFINYFTLIKDDGGGINTGVSDGSVYKGQKVTGNILINGIGMSEGTDRPGTSSSNGIYMDDNSANVEITDNTVSNCGNSGIILHNSSKITVKNNTLFNNTNQLIVVHDLGRPDALPRNYIIRNNIFFSKIASQVTSNISTLNDDIKLIGTLDSNYHCRPVDDNLVMKASFVNTSGTRVDQILDLKGWQTTYAPYGMSSKKTPVQIPAYTVSAAGVNKIANGTFNTNNSGVYSSSSSSWNSNKLDGGTFQASNASSTQSTYSVVVAAGAIIANKNYVLKFSSQAAKDTILNVYLRMSASPYSKLSDVKVFKVTSLRQENDFLFTLPAACTDASIVFETKCPKLVFWLDNIQLYEAEVTITSPDDYIRFEYNPTNAPKTIPLSGVYVDSKNNMYSTSITLNPYSSAVLVKRQDLARPAPPPSLIDLKGSILNNIADLKWTTYTQKGISHYELEKSSDKVNFVSFNKIAPGNFMGISRNDQSGNAGTGTYYRLKQIDEDGKFAYSNVVYLENTQNLSLEVMPNPTHSILYVWIRGLDKGDNITLSILSMSGKVLKSYNLRTYSQTVPVDVSSLINGVYILKVVAENNSAFKQFVKM